MGMGPAAQAYTQVTSFTYDGTSYAAYSSPTEITWTEARNYALSVNGDLASLDTALENAAVFSEIEYTRFPSLWTAGTFYGPYIGLAQQPGSFEPTAGWKWVDNTQLSYDDWYTNQPDNGFGLDNVAFYYRNVAKWADVYDCSTLSSPCSSNNSTTVNPYLAQSFIVEFNIVKVPGPAPVLGGIAAMGWARRLRRRARKYTL